ncbi:hypothetical protein KQI88_00360 [Alkaliphilus sp. MSJ-5]|uniref:DUF2178 domain-containing protein n=1 Tax=Alkaliphilus flagellatus TaxID=2841507 RepID=A0ABS6G0I4_9FIRM|nr:hypothetical protein [Alkaliphilus flagellatus]MBU5674866.1 hypothetical protein [Alkaliphilus flagellatus]
MLCKSVKNNRFWQVLIVVGIVTLVFGIVYYSNLPKDAHNMSMLMGMFSGTGGAFVAIGVIKLIQHKRTAPEKLRQKEIELKDERNIQILRIAYTIANLTATILFIIMAFVFVWLDYKTPAFISLGAMYIQLLAFFIAYKYFNSKM